ncbi:MAG: quinone-dependent dihydroorotate dehydrogenase [Pseudomonadota bacterium]
MFDRERLKTTTYDFFKNIIFRFDPETAHRLSLQALQAVHQAGLSRFLPVPLKNPVTVMGIHFPNPVGLAAGMDKNADYLEGLAALGFGFIEVGTVTPKAQEGNAAPRLFRLIHQQAIINRMGFNNKGCDYVVDRLRRTTYRGVLGVNIGKNFSTPLANAKEDYVHVFRQVAPYASYVTLNISSPNTQALRELQKGELLQSLLQTMKQEQGEFLKQQKKYVPLVIKIAPDLTDEELKTIAEVALAEKIDGIIATNTTISRAGVEDSIHAKETGGLSGKPLTQSSTLVIQKLQKLLQNKIPIIASGGVSSAEDAQEKIAAGAKLVQLYSGLVYRGPWLVAEAIASCSHASSHSARPA